MMGPGQEREGYYFGTEVGGKWWKRYRADTFFMRGNGTYWHDASGLYFLRHLTKRPLFIPFSLMRDVRSGRSHSGKWVFKEAVVKIGWRKDGLDLSSGFIFGDGPAMTTMMTMLNGKISGAEEAGRGTIARG